MRSCIKMSMKNREKSLPDLHATERFASDRFSAELSFRLQGNLTRNSASIHMNMRAVGDTILGTENIRDSFRKI